MKVTLPFRLSGRESTRDVMFEYLMGAQVDYLAEVGVELLEDLTEEQRVELNRRSRELNLALTRVLVQWVKYGFKIKVQFDTETGTCAVVPTKDYP